MEKPETRNKGESRKCVIDVRDLYKIYPIGKNEVRALNGVSFQVYEGEFCAIVGTSGSGKSTLLNMLAGLEKPTKGQIMVAGERIDKYKENRLRLEPFHTTRPPEFGVCDDVFPGPDINDLVIKTDKGVQFCSFSVAPQRDKFSRRNTHERQFSVPEIGLNPGNTGLDRAFPQGFNLPAEGLVKDFRQCFAVCAVFGVDRPGLRQKVVRFLVDKFLQDRVFDLRV